MKVLTLFKRLFFTLFLGIMPLAAQAASVVKPQGQNTWDLFVYGNGPAIAQILTAIKLMLTPVSGVSYFNTLLLFLATVGFLLMAVKAGFDPAKNFLKMFSFILTVWFVHYVTFNLTANINVDDRFNTTGQNNTIVTGVPAIVGIPAAVISQAGEFLTQQIEQNFSLPNGADSSSMNMSTGGQYGLFAKIMSDAHNYTVSDPDIKRSLTAYISDCGVTAMALGRMPLSGLTSSPNIMSSLAAANSQAVMTRYYPPVAFLSGGTAAANGSTTNTPQVTLGSYCSVSTDQSTMSDGTTPGFNSGQGILVSCKQAYDCINGDVNAYANALMNSSSSQILSSGIAVPLGTAMSSALSMAGASGGGNQFAGYSSSESYILQNAMLSVSQGAFRSAAATTGNNEVMMAASIAQAEQSQKSSWWTASEIFKNMMGYVFTVLQAFVFAMGPIVLICLMIPGMGAKIFINYAQILVWLTLWAPMLAIVNFLIEIFGSATLSSTLGANGLTMQNRGLIDDATNNLVIVSSFMATLVPIMTWGLVKGALAFTEFITHGIGSAFATQAGAQAATGNVSMGNLSMDNVGMNKYSTQMSSAVGYQPVEIGGMSGSASLMTDFGGGQDIYNKSAANTSVRESNSLSVKLDDSHSETMSRKQAENWGAQNSQMASEAQSTGQSVQTAASALREWSESHQSMTAEQRSLAASASEQGSRALDAVHSLSASVSGGVDAHAKFNTNPVEEGGKASDSAKGGKGIGLGASIGADVSAQNQKAERESQQFVKAVNALVGSTDSASSSVGTGDKGSAGSSASHSEALNKSIQNAEAISQGWSKVSETSAGYARNAAASLSGSTDISQSRTYSPMDPRRAAGADEAQAAAITAGVNSNLESAAGGNYDAAASKIKHKMDGVAGDVKAESGGVTAAAAGAGITSGAVDSSQPTGMSTYAQSAGKQATDERQLQADAKVNVDANAHAAEATGLAVHDANVIGPVGFIRAGENGTGLNNDVLNSSAKVITVEHQSKDAQPSKKANLNFVGDVGL